MPRTCRLRDYPLIINAITIIVGSDIVIGEWWVCEEMGEEKNGAKFSYQLYRFAVYTFP